MYDKRDYILKITNATGLELIIISYDLLLDNINEAITAHKNAPEAFIAAINRARDVLMELIAALNMDYKVSREIYPLYLRVNTLLISALAYEKKEKLEEAVRILTILREGWVKVREHDPMSDRLYKSAPKVYTGLTYGRKGPNDYVEANPSRGIEA
ncbi:MAG: flagellar protein FliS [Clostridiales bacterium]|jgi:flagellar protein FliS|nr:flagellar protein FliS [Clostridiales bacterium]